MDQNIIEHVQDSWKKVSAIAPQAGVLFYQNLFEADPSLKILFTGEITEQADKLMQMMGAAVDNLNDLDTLIPVLQGLAKRHDGYGVTPAHYEAVGAALIKTLGQGLGDDFTPEVKDSWTTIYGIMSDVMISASEVKV